MSFSALLCAQSFPVQHWDTATVDQILIEGDRMYLNALESQRIPDTDTLSLIYLPNQARSTVQSPAIEVTDQNQSPVEVTKSPSEANNSRQSPVEAKTILNKSAITVTNTDLPIVVEPVEAQINANDNPLWSAEYKEFYQGRVNSDEYENEGPYLTLRSALMNAFNDNNFAFIILEGYIIALINTVDCIIKMKGCLLFPNVSCIFIFKGEHSPQYDYIYSHCVSKNSLSIWRTLIPHFLSVTLLLHD